jgi:hypothetical protein
VNIKIGTDMKKIISSKIVKNNPSFKNKCGLKEIKENIAKNTLRSLNEQVYNPDLYGLIRNRTK